MSNNFKYRVSIVAIIKNEAAYIEEWVKYHLVVGIDHFYIFDNGSTDGTLELLEPYIRNNKITLIDFPGFRMQIKAYNTAIRKFKNESKYIAFIDADEFIFPHDKKDICEIVDSHLTGFRNGGLVVNWRMFGSSGHEKKPDGYVIENYLYRANDKNGEGNQCIKSIVNPRKVLWFHNPHYPVYYPFVYAVSEKNKKVKKWENYDECIKEIQLNHYFTKSKEEWIKRRGVARADTGTKRQMDEFYKHDNNDIYDDRMLDYVGLMKKL